MARVMICDDDRALTDQLVAALRAAGHEATACNHTMDVLREAQSNRFDLIAFGLDMAGFGGARAIDALHELAPGVSLIGLHHKPSEVIRNAQYSNLVAILPRPVSVATFMYAINRALEARERRPMDATVAS